MRTGFLSIILVAILTTCNHEDDSPQPDSPAGGAMDKEFGFYHFTPKVISPTSTDPVLLEVHNEGATDHVLHTVWGSDLQLHDDGRNGDKVAADSIFSALIDSKLISPLIKPTSVNRPLIGQYSLKAGYASIFAEIWSDDIPLLTPQRVTGFLQRTPHLVNIAVDKVSPNNLEKYVKEFYSHFSDSYDFIVVIYPGFNINRHHVDVKLDIKGIGKPAYNNASAYGSSGRLQGISVFPSTTNFDAAGTGWQHELGHQWINFLSGTHFQSGIPHWPLSDLANSIMGFSPGGGQGLTFPYNLVSIGNDTWRLQPKTDPRVFNDLELYLMGLIPAEEVAPHIVFENENQVLQDNAIIKGPVKIVTVDDIISTFGKREPDYLNSNKKFNIATVVITNTLLSDYEISFYDYFSSRAQLKTETDVREGYSFYKSKPFFLSTKGRAEISVDVN